MKIFPLLGLLILICSCNSLIQKIRQEKRDLPVKSKILEKTYCTDKSEFSLLGADHDAQNTFYNTLRRLPTKELRAVDKFVLWALFQMQIRPDTNSPTAPLEIVHQSFPQRSVLSYWKFERQTNHTATPYLYGLETILKYFKSKYTLTTLAHWLDLYLPEKLPLEEDLYNFVKLHSLEMLNYSPFELYFFRGKELVKKNDRLDKILLSPVIQTYNREYAQPDFYTIQKNLYSFPNNKDTQCSQDLQKYQNNSFNILPQIPHSHLFAFYDSMPNEQSFFSAFSGTLSPKVTPFEETPFFTTVENKQLGVFCFSSKIDSVFYFLWSTESRDPAQHLYFLISNWDKTPQNISELDLMIKHPRFLYLNHPKRFLIENQRMEKKELREFLKEDIPIYNAETLGKIAAFFSSSQGGGFIADDRYKQRAECYQRK